MKTWIVIAIVAALAPPLSGCQNLLDAFNSGENERIENERNRADFHREKAEKLRRKLEPIASRASKPVEKERVVKLDPLSPEGALFEVLEARLSCQAEACRSERLRELRARRAELVPALPKLFQGQRMAIRLEAVRLAGLFRHKPSASPIGRLIAVEQGKIREEGIWALGSIGQAQSLSVLERLAQLDNPPRIMDALCKAVGQLGHIGGFETIETLYLAGSRDTKIACLQAAATLPSPKRQAFIERATADPRAAVSSHAKQLLVRLQTQAK